MKDQSSSSDPSAAPPTEKTIRRRGIYLLPNLFTTGTLFAGFYAIVAGMTGRFEAAAIAVFIAMLMDGLDGRVARLTNTTSDFGVQYDSLADLVAFGLAPALVVFQWGFQGMVDMGWLWSKLGWIGAFFYTVAAALRLARFNVHAGSDDKRFFQGLPSPSAAAVVAGTVWVGADMGVAGSDMSIPAYAITVLTGALMVSNIGYYSFKDLNLTGRVAFSYVLLIPLLFILVAMAPAQMLFVIFFLYALSGPLWSAWRWSRRRRATKVVE